jgi:hypothetical protein
MAEVRPAVIVAIDGGPDVAGKYLAAYDPDAYDGRGHSRWTADPAAALTFDTASAAFECWRQVSGVRPTRPDGLPNRPLTAITVSIEPRPEGLRPGDPARDRLREARLEGRISPAFPAVLPGEV